METSVLVEKFEKLPESSKKEVEDFVDFLIYKNENQRVKTDVNSSFKYNIEEDKSSLNSSIINEPSFKKPKLKREFGGLKGFVTYMAEDFDAPIDDFKDYM